ncbi:MAG: hypothetical protein J0H29_10305 [Sphingobacteriales bacterium]|nr:hypothetical protein [Sphingobacteriales bacterium]OJY85514.1 MAG: hypothetical protein BGP14_13660 [Sphingobacteriales bacterium 44-15]
MAKDFRKKYAFQNCKISSEDLKNIPELFYDSAITDITQEYLPVSNVQVNIKDVSAEKKYVYLGVLNGKYWQTVQIAPIIGNRAEFKSMSNNILYTPLFFETNKIILAGNAFLLDDNGLQQPLTVSTEEKTVVRLRTDRINWLEPNEVCHLIYWDGSDWMPTGESQIFNNKTKEIVFIDIPSNTMYRIINDDRIKNQESNYGRPFIFNKRIGKFLDY